MTGVISVRLHAQFGPILADWPSAGRETAVVERPGPHDGIDLGGDQVEIAPGVRSGRVRG